MLRESIDKQLFDFRNRLLDQGLNPIAVDERLEVVRNRITQMVIRVLTDATVDAANTAVGMAGKTGIDFVRDLRPDPDAFKIDTWSGKTEYGAPRHSMRSYLLKNAKVAKDGTLYKVIPISEGGSSKQHVFPFKGRDSGQYLNIEDAQKSLLMKFQQMLDDELGDKKGLAREKVKFRTITSKQDPTMWIHPGFKRDFSATLQEVNEAVRELIKMEAQDIIAAEEGQGALWDL